jgi:hypothetical protein
MKDIRHMNLAELANALQRYEFDMLNDQVAIRLRELHDLTRWIPVSERMPTDDDADQFGEVLGTNDGAYAVVLRYYDFIAREDITHWQRITPPETP